MSQNSFMKDTAYDVFISYSHMDKNVTEALCHFLEEKRIRCWYAPRDILPGQGYADAIEQAMDNVKVFVLICSSHSLQSNWVHKETNLAVSDEKIIIPFKIENCSLDGTGMKLYLNDRHWIDAVPYPNAGFDRLAAAISDFIGMNREETMPPPETGTQQNATQQNATQRRIEANKGNNPALRPDMQNQFEYNKRFYSKSQIIRIAYLLPWQLYCALFSIVFLLICMNENSSFLVLLLFAFHISNWFLFSFSRFIKKENLVVSLLAVIMVVMPIINYLFIFWEANHSRKILNAAGLKMSFAGVPKKDLAAFEENNWFQQASSQDKTSDNNSR